jgi:hypothetical protein
MAVLPHNWYSIRSCQLFDQRRRVLATAESRDLGSQATGDLVRWLVPYDRVDSGRDTRSGICQGVSPRRPDILVVAEKIG